MDYINYVKQQPMTGFTGFGGGAASLQFHEGAGDGSYSAAPYGGAGPSTRAVTGGGYVPGSPFDSNIMNYFTVASPGNATDFGDLSHIRQDMGAVSNGPRGVYGGGHGGGEQDIVDYITIASTGNATDFGDLTQARHGIYGISNDTRGIFVGGTTSPKNVMDYITIASTGNATDFGDYNDDTTRNPGAVNDHVRGVIACSGTHANAGGKLEYITIATTGDSSDFGDLNWNLSLGAGASNTTTGIFIQGSTSPGKAMDWITIQTLGDGADFGDLIVTGSMTKATGSDTRLVRFGAAPFDNVIEYVTYASTSNAVDFGNLTYSASAVAGTSNGHGGL